MHKPSLRYFNSFIYYYRYYMRFCFFYFFQSLLFYSLIRIKRKKFFFFGKVKKKLLWAKPQNRTEVSPTTMECSTVELELPLCVSFIIMYVCMWYSIPVERGFKKGYH